MAKLLLIDDDPLLLRMYQTKFQADGMEVETASDGIDGLAKISSFQPDLVLLDVMMPKMNGLDVLKKIKENEQTKKIPVVMLTNVSSSDTDEQSGLALGAVAYLVKAHYTPKEVLQKVKEILGGYVRELPKVTVPVKEVSPEAEKKRQEMEKAKKELEEAEQKLKKLTS